MNRKKSYLPEWFKLENYDALYDLTAKEFLVQVHVRTLTWSYLNESPSTNNLPAGELSPLWLESVPTGSGVIPLGFETSSKTEMPFVRADGRKSLAFTGSIAPISFFNLRGYDNTARKKEIYLSVGQEDYSLEVDEFESASVSLDPDIGGKTDVLNHINLEYTDDQILLDLKKLLPMWRQQLNIPEPESRGRIGKATFRKLAEYQVIPLFDLMIWAKYTGSRIPAERLSRALYPDSCERIYDSHQIKVTVKPFALDFLDENYFFACRLFLEKEGIDSWSMRDVMRAV